MKQLRDRAVSVVAGLGALMMCGCISHERTVYRDVPRVAVEFENDRAAHIFYEALSRAPGRRDSESKTSVAIPIVFSHSSRVVPGQNVHFNDAVAVCDSNQDGKITEQEAQIFADRRVRHHSRR